MIVATAFSFFLGGKMKNKFDKMSFALAVGALANLYAPAKKKLTKKEIYKQAKKFAQLERDPCQLCGDYECRHQTKEGR